MIVNNRNFVNLNNNFIKQLLDEHADISAALSQPISNQDTDIDELENDLEQLLKEDEDKKKLPQSPPQVISGPSTIEDDEKAALELLKELDLNGNFSFLTSICIG